MPVPKEFYYGPNRLDLPAAGGLLLVRHAERPPILTLDEAYVTDLTAAGRAAARAFGVQLGQRRMIGDVFASPVSRCIHTAEEIVCGALDADRPHAFVVPLPVLHFDQRLTGIPGLASIYLNDPGFIELAAEPHSPRYALLKNTLLSSLPVPSEPGVVNLACTHDVIVTFLIASLLGMPSATLDDFPGYLEGIFLVRQGDTVQPG
jgi:hypothetical protein